MSRGFGNVNSARHGAANNVSVATTSTAAASAAFGSQTYQVRIAATAACNFKIGDPAATPTATTSDALLPANRVQFITVTPGQKISFFSPTIQTINVREITQ